MINLTPGQLRKAADIKERIDALQNELSELLGSEASTPAALEAPEAPRNGRRKKRKKVGAQGRARMAAAQKARWASIKGTAPAATPSPAPKKRKMSAQGLANIRAGVAKRMAAQGKAPAAKPAKKAKKKLSAAGLANIRAAQKARWAKAKAGA